MKNKSNLRFLLALGNQKVVVLEQAQNLHIYADKKNTRANVSLERLSSVMHTK